MNTKQLSSRVNAKQNTGGDFPVNPATPITYVYGPVVSTASQTVINLTFAVDQNNKNNFQLTIDGRDLSEGSGNDYTFTQVINSYSAQITMNYPIAAGLNIKARYWGVAQNASSTVSLNSLQASVNQANAAALKNLLINGGFDVWQRGISVAVANGTSAYQADRWYAKNSLGTSGVLTYSQVAGSVIGSAFGASVKITTAPTAAQTNGCELYQTLENIDSMQVYNTTASMGINVKGLGNVTQIGIQFFYATTESKVTTAIGTETLVSVSSSGFSTGQIFGQNIGTAMTIAGSIGVRIRITGVSTGNLYDVNNGFVAEQAYLNIGSIAGGFSRAGRNFSDEFAICGRYYEKSYDNGIFPGTPSPNANSGMAGISGSAAFVLIPVFLIRKRAQPTLAFYSYVTGASGVIRDGSSGADVTAVFQVSGQQSFGVGTNVGTAGHSYYVHWTADSDI